MLWQLFDLETGESVSDPGPLPENWDRIFGMNNVADKLHDLAWTNIPNLGWFAIGPDPAAELESEFDPRAVTPYDRAIEDIKTLLQQSDWSMLPDVPMTRSKKQEWIEYRKQLRKLKYKRGFPENVKWPAQPE